METPPSSGSGPVLDWGSAIEQKAGLPAAPLTPSNGPVPEAVDKPPDGSSLDELDRETLADRQHTRGLRGEYADKAYRLAFWCLYGWAAMLFASGFVNGIRGLPLWSDKVIIAATTGVTVSVLAAFLGVIRGLFGVNGSNGNGTGKEKK